MAAYNVHLAAVLFMASGQAVPISQYRSLREREANPHPRSTRALFARARRTKNGKRK